jgi:hypothetical protein
MRAAKPIYRGERVGGRREGERAIKGGWRLQLSADLCSI